MESSPRKKRDRSQIISMRPGARLKRRVLVADRDATTASILSTPANAEHCEIVQARDGAHAYRLLKSDDDFQAAVINPMIPGFDGLELLRYMKSENRLKRIPIVVLAGENGLLAIAKGFAAGAVACLWKPVTADILWRTVRMLLPQAVAKRKGA